MSSVVFGQNGGQQLFVAISLRSFVYNNNQGIISANCLIHMISTVAPRYNEVSRYRKKKVPYSGVFAGQIVKPWSQDWLIAAGAYPGFYSMKRLEVFLLSLDGILVHRRSLRHNLSGFPNNLPVPIYTPRWREAL